MQVTIYFSEIMDAITEQIQLAKAEINVAVCWLTNEDLIKQLWKQQRKGVKVCVVIGNVESNFYNVNNFSDFIRYGAKLFVTPSPLMHNKFCLIDDKTIINGSYNWSYPANSNEENITILKIDNNKGEDSKVFDRFKNKHKNLCEKKSIEITKTSDLIQFRKTSINISESTNLLDKNEISLRLEFEEDVKSSLKKAQRKGVRPTPYIIEKMRDEGGGVQFVKRIIWDERNSNQMKSGFERLAKVFPHAVDCSFEYLVCKDKYKGLFTEVEINFCKNLMRKYNLTNFEN